MPAPILTFAILAGGAATRLGGRDKGLEPLGGRPLIAWVVDAVRSMDRIDGGEVVIVANRHLDEYARHAHTISDQDPGFRGPLAGIASALAACLTPWLLTVPVDCPEPPPDLAGRLLHGSREDAADCLVAHDGERRQPLFALYRRRLAESAAAAAATGQGVWQWQDAIGARELDFRDQRRQFHNLNTADDFTAYAARNHT